MPHRRRRCEPRIRRTGATTHPLPRPMRISPHHVTDGRRHRRRRPIATTGWKIAGDQRPAIAPTTVTTIMKPRRRSAGSVAAAAGGKAIGERICHRRNVIVMRRGSSDPRIDGRRRRQSGGRPNITNVPRRPPPVVLGIQTGIRVMSRGRAVISSDAELPYFFRWGGGGVKRLNLHFSKHSMQCFVGSVSFWASLIR